MSLYSTKWCIGKAGNGKAARLVQAYVSIGKLVHPIYPEIDVPKNHKMLRMWVGTHIIGAARTNLFQSRKKRAVELREAGYVFVHD